MLGARPKESQTRTSVASVARQTAKRWTHTVQCRFSRRTGPHGQQPWPPVNACIALRALTGIDLLAKAECFDCAQSPLRGSPLRELDGLSDSSSRDSPAKSEEKLLAVWPIHSPFAFTCGFGAILGPGAFERLCRVETKLGFPALFWRVVRNSFRLYLRLTTHALACGGLPGCYVNHEHLQQRRESV